MLLLRRWARMVCHSAVLPCSAAAASPVLACMVCYGTVLPRPPALPGRHCSVIIKPLLNVESKLNHYCSLWGAGEGVPVPHFVLATRLVSRHGSEFVTSKARRFSGLKAVAQASLERFVGGKQLRSVPERCLTAPEHDGSLLNSSGAARRLAS